MQQIPVTFDFKGKELKGFLSSGTGAGIGINFQLSANGYHYGQLCYMEGHPGFNDGVHAQEPRWRFASNTSPQLQLLAEHFGYVVTAWLASKGS